jgi:hypothetical protein
LEASSIRKSCISLRSIVSAPMVSILPTFVICEEMTCLALLPWKKI